MTTRRPFRTRLRNAHGRKRLRSDAPFSGRLPYCGGNPCGMVRAAMQRLAAGFVGTLGPVDRDCALETAQVFLERAFPDDGVQPAELLHERRAAAFRELTAATGSARAAAKNRLFNASMFVFYGDPRARVRIFRPAGGGMAHPDI